MVRKRKYTSKSKADSIKGLIFIGTILVGLVSSWLGNNKPTETTNTTTSPQAFIQKKPTEKTELNAVATQKQNSDLELPPINSNKVVTETNEMVKVKNGISKIKKSTTIQNNTKTIKTTKQKKVANNATNSKFQCGKRTCGQMNSCAEAKFHLRQCGVRSLDRDRDGIPCESLCG